MSHHGRTGHLTLTHLSMLAVSCSALLFGCSAEPQEDPQEESQEIVDNLIEAGFPQNDIQVIDGAVYVGRDAHVTLEASREMLEPGDSGAEQYRTTNLVSGKPRICVNPSAEFNSYPVLSTGLDLAIENYNVLNLVFAFVRGPTTGCSANISAVPQVGLVGGSAGFPSGGNPYGQIIIGTGIIPYGTDVAEHVITHELGHTVGFRHSDYYNRSISCGSGGDEGDAGIGATLIPGTPSTATVGGSIMNSCFRQTETGELTSSDITALIQLSSYSFSAVNTNSAQQSTVNQSVTLNAGQTITAATCGITGSSFTGDTYLRLFGPSAAQVAFNDDACGGRGSSLSFTATATGSYQIHAGCYSSTSCSGTVAWIISPNQYNFSAANTNSAQQNTVNHSVTLNAGQTITVGTCGVPGSSFSGDTFLRLFDPSAVQADLNDDACGGIGSSLSFTATTTGSHQIRVGCYSSLGCSGTVAWSIQ